MIYKWYILPIGWLYISPIPPNYYGNQKQRIFLDMILLFRIDILLRNSSSNKNMCAFSIFKIQLRLGTVGYLDFWEKFVQLQLFLVEFWCVSWWCLWGAKRICWNHDYVYIAICVYIYIYNCWAFSCFGESKLEKGWKRITKKNASVQPSS